MQKSITECTAHWTLKKMSHSSRKPHWVPFLSAKDKNVMINSSGSWYNVWGGVLFTHFWSLSTNWARFKWHSVHEYCHWQCPSLCDHSVPSSHCCFRQKNASCEKTQIISKWLLENNSEFIHATMWFMQQPWGLFAAPCWIYMTKNTNKEYHECVYAVK